MRDSVFFPATALVLSADLMNLMNLSNMLFSNVSLEHHAWIWRCAAGRQPLRQAARMGFQLVAVRIEKIQGIAGAAVLLPFRHTSRAQAGGKGGKIVLRNGERVVRVATRADRRARIERQAQP